MTWIDDKVNDHIKSNSGGSETSSPQSSRESSPSRQKDNHGDKSLSSSKIANDNSVANKSATIPASLASSEKQKQNGSEKPKKKSKLSFLSRKKNKD